MSLFNGFFSDYRVYEIRVGSINKPNEKHHCIAVSSVVETDTEHFEVERDYRECIRNIVKDEQYTHEIHKVCTKNNIGVIEFGYWDGLIIKEEFVPSRFNLIWRIFMEYDKLEKNWRKVQ